MLKQLPDYFTKVDILFVRYLLGKSNLHQDKDYNDGLGADNRDERNVDEAQETGWNQRILLSVEKEKKIQVLEERQAQQRQNALLTSYFQKILLSTIKEKLKDTKKIINDNLQMQSQQVDLLITLVAREPRYSLLAEQLKADSYIRNHLMSLVASQDFMTSLGRNKRIVDDLQIAVGMMGTHALRYVVPALMFKQRISGLKVHNQIYLLFVKKLWRYQLTLGQACTVLMQEAGYRRPYEGHILAAMLNFAYTASFNQYSASFEQVRHQCIAESREKDLKKNYLFYQDFKPDLASFQSLMIGKSDLRMSLTLATEIFPKDFKHLLLALKEQVDNVDFEARSLLGKIVYQATCFARYEQLRVVRIFKREWLDDYLTSSHLSVDAFKNLSQQDLFRFKPNWS
jgi:hypothetical protein